LHASPPSVCKLHIGGEHAVVSKKFIKAPLPLKSNKSWVAVAVVLLPLMKTEPLPPGFVSMADAVPSDNVRLNATMSKVESVPINPLVVIVPVTEPTPTGTFT
jgi:hypothetical protein